MVLSRRQWVRLENLVTKGKLVKLLYSVDHEIVCLFVLDLVLYIVLAYHNSCDGDCRVLASCQSLF